MAFISNRIPLTEQEKATFFTSPGRHLDYRYTMLMRSYRNLSTKDGDRICAFETTQIACRMFMNFLGVASKCEASGPRLVPSRKYYSEDGVHTDEVKVTDLGGTFVNIGDLTGDDASLMATVCHTANKATAHLTYNAKFMGDWDDIHRCVPIIERLLHEHLYSRLNLRPRIIL